MKKLMLGLLAALGIVGAPACTKPAEPAHEASMNFDLENVEPFLSRIEQKFNLGLNPKKLATFTSETALETERSTDFVVQFEGKEARLTYRVFMDDMNAPDLYFYSKSKPLTEAINRELLDFADEKGL